MTESELIAEIVAEALKPIPQEKSVEIVLMCRHNEWHPIKAYCLNCHVARETLFFKPWASN